MAKVAQQDYDGSRIKRFVENERSFIAHVEKKFDALDTDHDGKLSAKELAPVMESLGCSLGLPPPGSDQETDHIYKEVFSDFTNGKSVTKDTFAHVLKDVYLGLAEGLERDPISVIPLDGRALEEYVESGTFQTDTVSSFTRLDSESQNRLKAIMLVEAMKTISVSKGMPPVMDPKMKPLLRDALVTSKVNTEDFLDQFQFVDTLKAVLLSIARGLQKSTVFVACSEKVYDGKTIVALLKDEQTLHQVLGETWKKMPKDKHGNAPRDYLRIAVDEISPAAGLPPLGAVDEVDDVLQTVFNKTDLDSGGSISREEFDKILLQILGSLMLQLEGKPVSTRSGKIVEDSSTPVAPLAV